MSKILIHRCTACGVDVEPTPAVVASGGAHPACRFRGIRPAALTAAAFSGLDGFALELWQARRDLRTLRRRGRGRRR